MAEKVLKEKKKTVKTKASVCDKVVSTLPKKSPFSWYVGCLKKYVKFSGRATRAEFWSFILINAVIFVGLYFLDEGLGIFPILSGIFAALILLPLLSVMFRRLHDSGLSGWWAVLWIVAIGDFVYTFNICELIGKSVPAKEIVILLLSLLLIPVLYQILLLVFLSFRTQPCENKYGDVPH